MGGSIAVGRHNPAPHLTLPHRPLNIALLQDFLFDWLNRFKCARESGFDRENFIRKLVRGIPVKRNSYQEFVRWLSNTNTAKMS